MKGRIFPIEILPQSLSQAPFFPHPSMQTVVWALNETGAQSISGGASGMNISTSGEKLPWPTVRGSKGLQQDSPTPTPMDLEPLNPADRVGTTSSDYHPFSHGTEIDPGHR